MDSLCSFLLELNVVSERSLEVYSESNSTRMGEVNTKFRIVRKEWDRSGYTGGFSCTVLVSLPGWTVSRHTLPFDMLEVFYFFKDFIYLFLEGKGGKR